MSNGNIGVVYSWATRDVEIVEDSEGVQRLSAGDSFWLHALENGEGYVFASDVNDPPYEGAGSVAMSLSSSDLVLIAKMLAQAAISEGKVSLSEFVKHLEDKIGGR